MEQINLEVMSEAERRQLYEQLSYDFGRVGSKQAKALTDDQQLVWDVINETLHHRRDLDQTLAKAGKEYTRTGFGEDVEQMMGWINRGCGKTINRTQRRALVTLVIDCLVTYLPTAARTHKGLIQNLEKAEAVLDLSFPGYAEAKILDRLAAIAQPLAA